VADAAGAAHDAFADKHTRTAMEVEVEVISSGHR